MAGNRRKLVPFPRFPRAHNVLDDLEFERLLFRASAWLNRFPHLRLRYEKRSVIPDALLTIGCALICCILLHRWLWGRGYA